MIDNLKTYKYLYIDHEQEVKIEEELINYLKKVKKENLTNELSYIIKEMVGNANKANMKRVHFSIKELNIANPDDYEKGIKTFRDEMSSNYKTYITSAKNFGYFVRLDFYTTNGYLVLSIMNNTEILPLEKERLMNKIKYSAKFNTFEEALMEGLDTKEGGGFGIILSIMMLRKMGLNERFFKIKDNDKYTQTEIIIPLSLISQEEGEKIAATIIKEIDEIPQFPQHIIELEKILSDPNANFTNIYNIIKKDPSLIADLLKIANSALYMLPQKVNSIQDAVRLIGFKGIRNLVVTYTTRNILMNRYNLTVIKQIMEHSYEVAYYAYEMSKKLKLKNIIDDVYLCGILHDFGKIIVNSIKPGIMDKIKELCHEKGINRDIIEDLTSGYNHSTIGAKLAEKWNFPDILTDTILNHHNPLEANDNNRDLIYMIYLADIMYYYRRKDYDFMFITYKVLKYYDIEIQETFDKFCKSIFTNFTNKKKDI